MAEILRRYSAALTTTDPTTVVSAVASARALAISKIIVAASGTSTITISLGGSAIATALPMTAGQVYTESNLVLLAGETVSCTASAASVLVVSVCGAEVDN